MKKKGVIIGVIIAVIVIIAVLHGGTPAAGGRVSAFLHLAAIKHFREQGIHRHHAQAAVFCQLRLGSRPFL